jgi:phosphoglycolate phosphatase-like HAD superfamily hydrolase
MIETIIFDFDDTLVQSEQIKQRGFSLVFGPDVRAMEIAAEVKSNYKSTPRKESIQYILEALRKEGLLVDGELDDLVEEYVQKYTEEVDGLVIAADEVAGAEALLKQLHGNYKLYVNSATPQASLGRIIEGRGWREYFGKIYGQPPGTKSQHMDDIMSEGNNPETTVVIGDGNSDKDNAERHGAKFAGLRTILNGWNNSEEFDTISALGDLPNWLKSA